MREFSIGSGDRAYHFRVDERGWISAVTRPDGSTPVIGGQFDLESRIEVPEVWSEVDEATGFNGKIADGEEFYPGAGFDESLVDGQVADVMWALRSARAGRVGRLLELGCGPGFLLRQLSRALPGWQVTGIDPSAESVRQAQTRGLDVIEGFIDTAGLEGSFDAFVVMGNFQLHSDPAQTLVEMGRFANPGAELYLDLKNPLSTPRRAAQRLVTVPVARNNAKVHAFAAHAWHGLRHGIPKSAIPELMSSTGWRVVEIRTVGPRLLRFGNKHSLSRGPKGVAWRTLDAVDGLLDERAWTQVAAVRA